MNRKEVVILSVKTPENLLELRVLVRLIEEVIEFRYDHDGEKTQDNVQIVVLHQQEGVKDDLEHHYGNDLHKSNEECQVGLFKLPCMVQCVLHVGEALL